MQIPNFSNINLIIYLTLLISYSKTVENLFKTGERNSITLFGILKTVFPYQLF